MNSNKAFSRYQSDGFNFVSREALKLKRIYFPLCGISSGCLKSSITPCLGGDIKIDKERFLTKPVSREDLLRDVRDFFVRVEGKGVFSLAQETAPDSAHVEAGALWHKLARRHPRAGLEMTALNFVPATGENVELMRVTVRNIFSKQIRFVPTFSLPIFGRALANKHDHEHVTSLLQRVRQVPDGVLVKPTMVFDERGHRPAESVYFVFGCDDRRRRPAGSFPTVENFLGEAGTLADPEAVRQNRKPGNLNARQLQGKEAMGALRFAGETLKPGAAKEYFLVFGIGRNEGEAARDFRKFDSGKKFDAALKENQIHWNDKARAVSFETADAEFNAWMRWVALQPVFRRIFGCSFLPDHDYGKGGKGWRDLWQDLLSSILVEPQSTRAALIRNFAGVRIDGSNATVVGDTSGEFLADRNNISRVWMDHGAWPLVTVLLYIQQTGDTGILFEKAPYFRDPQLSRSLKKDWAWTPASGSRLKTKKGAEYQGTILEHILIQHLVQFFNVGAHNLIRLESADWNDGLDMAFAAGESAAFTSLYAGNFLALAGLLQGLAAQRKIKKIVLAEECRILLDSLASGKCGYNSVSRKRKLLFKKYFRAVEPDISGRTIEIKIEDVIKDLRRKGEWLLEHLRRREKVRVRENGREFSWFNGYYDNRGRRVEGKHGKRVRMTLTGQVFAVLSGAARENDIKDVIQSVDYFLKDKKLGGLHLNTDFGVDRYLEFGRAFSFAYGTKENGAFFNHMSVMYAYALYKRGFAREGHEVLRSIWKMSASPESKIYPGIPEYFDLEGRGMYPYLTGSASWLVFTLLTQVFGARGEKGDLVLEPKLVKEQFDAEGYARVIFPFAGKQITVDYENKRRLDAGEYVIREVSIADKILENTGDQTAFFRIRRNDLAKLSHGIEIFVKIGPRP